MAVLYYVENSTRRPKTASIVHHPLTFKKRSIYSLYPTYQEDKQPFFESSRDFFYTTIPNVNFGMDRKDLENFADSKKPAPNCMLRIGYNSLLLWWTLAVCNILTKHELMMLRISFIIPVYNVKPYLRQCVESITRQDYEDIEVVLVDDESTDGSSALCDELAGEDCRISVVHQMHGGLSRARNAGLEYVTGEYLTYVDSDDLLESRKGMFDELVKIIGLKGYPDFIACNFSCFYHSGRVAKHRAFVDALCRTTTREDALKFLVTSGHIPVQAWGKLLKTSFVKKSGLMFIENHLSEDNPWFIDLLDKADSFLFLNEYIYLYRYFRPGSITASFSLHYFDSQIENIVYLLGRMTSFRFAEQSGEDFYSFLAMLFCTCMMQLHKLPENVRREKWQQLKQYSFLLGYDKHPGVHLVNMTRKCIGLDVTKWLLQMYDRIR